MANNNDKKKVASTRGSQYYGQDSKESKALATRFFGDMAAVSVHRPLPESQQTRSSKYDYKTGTEVYLRPKSAKSLARLLDNARHMGPEKFGSKALGSGPNLIEVGYGAKYGMDENQICLAMYTDLDPETKAAKNQVVFAFNTTPVICDYNHSDGSHTFETIDGDVAYLIDQLEDFAKGMTNGRVHASKKDTQWSLELSMNRQLAMMSHMGIIDNNNKSGGPNVLYPDWGGKNQSGQKSKGTTVKFSGTSSDLANEIAELG